MLEIATLSGLSTSFWKREPLGGSVEGGLSAKSLRSLGFRFFCIELVLRVGARSGSELTRWCAGVRFGCVGDISAVASR
jgi:hypothetical protein